MQEFQQSMLRLENTYGKNFYSEERRRLIWKYAERIPLDMFTSVLDKLISTSRFAPLPYDFIAEIRPLLSTDRFKGLPDCLNCRSTGLLSAIKKGAPTYETYAFSCYCKRGNVFTSIPTWSGEYSKEFTLK